MSSFAYLLGVVAVGWGVTVGLRFLPFVLFAGRDRELPRWVERFGNFISPVIIAALVVYSYSGLAWQTCWPYLAGALTVGLQLLFRNPLASILAGTILYMCALNCGCASRRVLDLDARDPDFAYTAAGVRFEDTTVPPEEVADILEEFEVPKDRVIHIRLAPDVKDLRGARRLMALLARRGYARSILVTERHAESAAVGKRKPAGSGGRSPAAAPTPPKIRYKRAGE